MTLYHGSTIEVKNPIIIESELGKDFGFAFYLTPIREQAERMAKRKQLINHSDKAIVSVFEWDENTAGLNIKRFSKHNLEWLEMILQCRGNPKFKHGFDIVEGKIVDDSVGETILFVMGNIITKEDAVKRLRYQKINSQIAFCSDRALGHIKFVYSYEVN